MAVDTRGIEVALVKTVRNYVGKYLSKYGDTQTASVIRSRLFSTGDNEVTPPFPDYPYASVDYTRTTDEGYELTSREFDDQGNYVYTSHKLASYTIRFFGTSQDDVMRICNEMHMLFEVDQVRNMVTELSPTEARVRSKTDPVFVATAMEDKYREIASFDVILSVLDQVVLPADPLNPPNKYNAIVEGEAAEHYNSIEMNTETPVDGVQGGIYQDGEDNPDEALHVNVNTTLP